MDFNRGDQSHFNYQTAFTLIELLVVISIMSLLSSIVMSGVRTAVDRVKAEKQYIEMKEVSRSIEMFLTKEGHYPDLSPEGHDNDVVGYARHLSGAPVFRYAIGHCGRSDYGLIAQLKMSGVFPQGFGPTTNNGLCYEFFRHDEHNGSVLVPGYEYVVYASDENLKKHHSGNVSDCYEVLGYTSSFFREQLYPHLVCYGVPYQGIYKPGQ